MLASILLIFSGLLGHLTKLASPMGLIGLNLKRAWALVFCTVGDFCLCGVNQF